jgi:hypothetical protein
MHSLPLIFGVLFHSYFYSFLFFFPLSFTSLQALYLVLEEIEAEGIPFSTAVINFSMKTPCIFSRVSTVRMQGAGESDD